MIPRLFIISSLLCALMHCTTNAAPVEEPPPIHVDQDRVNALSWDLETFLNYHRNQGVFYSMTVGIVRGKDLVYSRYIGGWPSRTYSVGSITKIFTSTAIERLMEKGVLNLDDRLGDVFPGLSIERPEYKSPRITLRHLLSHSSGMPDLRYYNPPEMVHHPEIDFPMAPQTAPAGVQFRYSNMGFQILGEVIKKKTGKSINQIIQSEVYDAAGMNESTMLGGSTGAYGVMTNVTDMAKFASMYLSRGIATNGHRILKEKSVLGMLENQIYSPPAEFKDYNGIGWRVRVDRQGVMQFYHIGGATGVAAWLQIFPRENVAIFYLGDPPKYEENTMGVLSGIMGKLGFLATAFAGKSEPIFPFKQSVSTESELSHFAGVYRDPVSGELASVSLNGQTVMVQKGSGPMYPTVPECRAIFNGGYGFVQHSFILDPKNESVVGVATNDSYYERLNR
ncbi:MAG: beta-lactamase family protein [Spirochaetia bacterium]|nr:beta-lactamase family protein [Spirochaetia bacterium]